MTVYIALLRGINVGGNNMIKMADLRRVLESAGLAAVQTYIQSGNILFHSELNELALCRLIEDEIKAAFGLTIPVILRTAEEIEWIAENCPFSEHEISEAEASSESESLYVAMLHEAPSDKALQKLSTYKADSEDYQVEGREVYMLFSNSIRNSKLANNVTKLGVHTTTRNWKTINKLLSLAREMSIE